MMKKEILATCYIPFLTLPPTITTQLSRNVNLFSWWYKSSIKYDFLPFDIVVDSLPFSPSLDKEQMSSWNQISKNRKPFHFCCAESFSIPFSGVSTIFLPEKGFIFVHLMMFIMKTFPPCDADTERKLFLNQSKKASETLGMFVGKEGGKVRGNSLFIFAEKHQKHFKYARRKGFSSLLSLGIAIIFSLISGSKKPRIETCSRCYGFFGECSLPFVGVGIGIFNWFSLGSRMAVIEMAFEAC